MGELDIKMKAYMSQSRHFADAFNFALYDGEQVIAPDGLRDIDTVEIALPYGYEAKTPLKKERDLLKIWVAKQDEAMIYVVLGIENQAKSHYAMPVIM